MTVRRFQYELPNRPVAAALTPEERSALDAAQRAMPLQRLTGNGMAYADAVALHAMATEGVPWPAAASWIGECNLQRAAEYERSGQALPAHRYFRYAAAAFRFGQSPYMLDSAEKLALYRRSLDAFMQAARLAPSPHEKVAIPFGGSHLGGWLIRPRDVARPNTVIIFGGADGWREEYHEGALFLIESGIGVLLLDGPGQGESRMINRVFLTPALDRAFSAAVTFLLDDPRTGDKVGIWGNSLGGNFALRTAATDPRIVACCDNSGPPAPGTSFDTFPRIVDRFRAMVGELEVSQTRAIFDAIEVTPQTNRVACNLLILQGNKDLLVSAADANMVYESAPSKNKTLVVWDDGDHCIYNHSHEKHILVADWFAKTLS